MSPALRDNSGPARAARAADCSSGCASTWSSRSRAADTSAGSAPSTRPCAAARRSTSAEVAPESGTSASSACTSVPNRTPPGRSPPPAIAAISTPTLSPEGTRLGRGLRRRLHHHGCDARRGNRRITALTPVAVGPLPCGDDLGRHVLHDQIVAPQAERRLRIERAAPGSGDHHTTEYAVSPVPMRVLARADRAAATPDRHPAASAPSPCS